MTFLLLLSRQDFVHQIFLTEENQLHANVQMVKVMRTVS